MTTQNLNTPETRAMIAEDVLALLKTGKIVAFSRYFDPSKPLKAGSDLRSQLATIEKCQVCGIGACFYAMVARFDGFDVPCGGGIISSAIRDKLSEAFTLEQVHMIEAAFECSIFDYHCSNMPHAVKFGLRFTPGRERMEAIMKNIIAHAGEFVPQEALA